jgi:simple sugar transport system ATP-binding protein
MTAQAAVVMRDITMSFGENTVLRGVDLTINSGQVTALLGANGAGKSTLIKILSGVYTGHGGVVEIDGESQIIDSPMTARRIGLQTVHQRIDEGVIPGLSIAENLLFERIAQNEIRRVASLRSLIPKAREVADSLNLEWSDSYLRKDVFEIGVADKQLLILARALARRPRLLILDEPTSALSQSEVDRLFVVINDLRSSGIPVLYVSHRLGEIETLADRLVVLRDGRIRGEQDAPFDWTAALKDMLGEQTLVELESFEERHGTTTVLDLKEVQLFTRSTPFDLAIRGGEVTGVIGLLGSGKSELARGIFGADPFVKGSMTLGGKAFAPSGPADAIHNDVYLVPEDRAGESMLPGWSIARTASLPFLKSITSRGILNFGTEHRLGRNLIDEFSVVAGGAEQEVDSLSGGNQQKVVVGRWLHGTPRVLLLDEPFRGVDIGARRDISRKAREVAGTGVGVIVLTSDIDEVLEVADRIVVLVDGVPRLDTYSSQTNRDQIVARMSEVA